MSFDILAARMYGTGALGTVTDPATQINSYAKVTARATNTITIDKANASIGVVDFVAGTEILLHISGAATDSGTADNLGKYKFTKIKSTDGDTLTLSDDSLDISTNNYYYQAITVPHYKSLTISNTISPPAFDTTKGYGGILVIKASSKLTLTGKIDLNGKGLPFGAKRPLLTQEVNGTLDTDLYSGYENYDTAKHFVLNVNSGAAMIIAKKLTFGSNARIGNPNKKGIQRCRGAADSYNLPEGVSNVGGSTILIAAETISEFDPAFIAKYRETTMDTALGLGRAYIATESTLPNDEGLYAYDCINTPERLENETGIKGYGDSRHGAANNSQAVKQQNNYAKVKSIQAYESTTTCTLTDMTKDGVAKFETGALVMIHASYKSAYKHLGRFIVAKVISTTTTSITLDKSINTLNLSDFDVSHYNFQAITIPQYSSYTLSGTNDKTLKYDGEKGGIFAIAVDGTCNLTGGKISVMEKGGSRYSLDFTSSNRMKHRLPIGAGHGSVFILAKTLKVNDDTRLGAAYTGAEFGGSSSAWHGHGIHGGYKGNSNYDSKSASAKYYGQGGSGAGGGAQIDGLNGGYANERTFNGNAIVPDKYKKKLYGAHGASLFIVANTIDGLGLACLSTGGCWGSNATDSKDAGSSGGCGYGGGGGFALSQVGGGGYHGGGGGYQNPSNGEIFTGGGAGGFCFIYCNKFTNQDTTYL